MFALHVGDFEKDLVNYHSLNALIVFGVMQ